MKYEKGQIIAGLPVLKVRDLLKKRESFNVDAIEYLLKVSRIEAQRILNELVSGGYLEPREGREGSYEKTPLGLRLATVSGTPRMTRAKADELILQAVTRAMEIAQDPDFTLEVKRMVLFGSYLDPQVQDLGDVDIAIDIDMKKGMTQEDLQAERDREADRGRQFGNYGSFLVWPYERVLRYLKNRKPGLSFVDLRHHVDMLKGIPIIQIYPTVRGRA